MTRLERAFKVVGVQIDNPAGGSGPNRNEPVARSGATASSARDGPGLETLQGTLHALRSGADIARFDYAVAEH